jgi:putative iron-dependent peroxidase
MSTAQPGIFAQGTRAHYYLEYDVDSAADPDRVLDALRALREPPVTAGGANIVIGFGADLWRRLAPAHAPSDLRPFVTVEGRQGHRAPAAQHDVWLWFHGTNSDVVLDMARAATVALAPAATLATELPAFVYKESRDMTGFIDGTENPPIWEAHLAALVPEGGPGASGSNVFVSKFLHDLGSFHALEEEEQERVIGRTKPDSVELDDDVRPENAHISRVVVEGDDGEELEVYRRSTPWGNVCEQGLNFVAFSGDIDRFERMLRRMYGVDDGIHDRLLDFTRAEGGAYYFAPSLDGLFAPRT